METIKRSGVGQGKGQIGREQRTFMAVKILLFVCSVAKSCLTLWDPMDCSPPGSSVHGILQARILEWVAMFSSRVSSLLRDQTRISCVSYIGRQVLYHRVTWGAQKWVWWVLKKVNMELLYNTAISLLGMYPKGLKAGTKWDFYTPKFIVALFTIFKWQKQLKWSLMEEWIF